MERKVIPYGRQNIDQEDIDAVIETLTSDYMTQGPKVKEFEDAVAKYHNCKYAVAFNNGTTALHAAYWATGITKGDEFITTPITFVASANGGLYIGATPKFVDISPIDYNIDVTKLEGAITDKTKVITPVSFAGYPVDLKAIREIVNKHKENNIKIIHDAAHAIGALRDNRNIVEYADMTLLSFHPVKHVATGEGGMILTNDEELYKKMLLFRTHGITRNPADIEEYQGDWYYEMQELGHNFRITDIQCALGITQLKKLDKSIFERNKIAKFYEEELKDLEWLKLPTGYFSKEWLNEEKYEDLKEKPKNINSYHLFPVQVANGVKRKSFFDYLRSNKIYVQVHYIPVHLFPYYKKNFGFKEGDFPIAEEFYSNEVSLPMFPTLKQEELRYIVDIIKKYK